MPSNKFVCEPSSTKSRSVSANRRRIRRPARKQNPAALDSSQLALDASHASVGNESEPDRELPDLTLPDLKLPDLKLPDLKLPDLKLPDLKLMAEPVMVADFVSSVAPDSDETRAIPWRPIFDDDDDLDGVLKAESPLLSRAFRGLGHHNSDRT